MSAPFNSSTDSTTGAAGSGAAPENVNLQFPAPAQAQAQAQGVTYAQYATPPPYTVTMEGQPDRTYNYNMQPVPVVATPAGAAGGNVYQTPPPMGTIYQTPPTYVNYGGQYQAAFTGQPHTLGGGNVQYTQPMQAVPVQAYQQQSMNSPQPQMQAYPIYAQQSSVGAPIMTVSNVNGQPVVMSVVQPVRPSYCCGCSSSCCAAYLNYAMLLMLFIAGISCIVSFHGSMHEIRDDKNYLSTISFMWNRYSIDGNDESYDKLGSDANSCKRGGKAFLAMSVLTFVCIVFYSTRTFVRLCKSATMTQEQVNRSLNRELGLSILSLLFMGIALVVWASTCVKYAADEVDRVNKSSVGVNLNLYFTNYAYMIISFCFLIACLVHLIYIRGNVALQNVYNRGIQQPAVLVAA